MRETKITFLVTDEEKIVLERTAKKEGRSVGNLIRRLLMLDQMLKWDHTAMRAIRDRIEDGVMAELEEIGKRKKGNERKSA